MNLGRKNLAQNGREVAFPETKPNGARPNVTVGIAGRDGGRQRYY
jgi:hypothetical protein